MRYQTCVIVVLASVFAVLPAVSEGEPSVQIQVTDQDGQPLSGVVGSQIIELIERASTVRSIGPSDANGFLLVYEGIELIWPDNRGRSTDEFRHEFWIAGKTYGLRRVIDQDQPFPERLLLVPSADVVIRAAGPTLPGFYPVIAPLERSRDALRNSDKFGKPEPVKNSDLAWSVSLLDDEIYVIGWIDSEPPTLPGKPPHEQPISRMYGFISHPFVASPGKEVVIEPGLPTSITYDMQNAPNEMNIFPARVQLALEYRWKDTDYFMRLPNEGVVLEGPGQARFDRLAGRTWRLHAEHSAGGNSANHPEPFLYDTRSFDVPSGEKFLVSPAYPVVDTTIKPGDRTITGAVVDQAGNALSDLPVWVEPWSKYVDQRYGAFRPSVRTDNGGRFKLEGLSLDNKYHVHSAASDDEHSYTPVGDAAYSADGVADIRIIIKGDRSQRSRRPRVGKPLDGLIIQWEDGEVSSLEQFKGKKVLIDVWATYCKPCIEAFPEYDALAKQYESDSNIVFLALSTDSGSQMWKTFLSENDLPNLRHGWIDPLQNSIQFPGLPHRVVIDPEGNVVVVGTDVVFETLLSSGSE
jgi:thiol-disulfide isomerase/thioredoxin